MVRSLWRTWLGPRKARCRCHQGFKVSGLEFRVHGAGPRVEVVPGTREWVIDKLYGEALRANLAWTHRSHGSHVSVSRCSVFGLPITTSAARERGSERDTHRGRDGVSVLDSIHTVHSNR